MNANQLKAQLESQGSIFQTTSDTEVLAHLMKRSSFTNVKDAVKNGLSLIKGAYAFVILTANEMILALDPHGLRPLSIGKVGDAYVVASETVALDIVGAEFVRDIEPGELVVINDEGITSEFFSKSNQRAMCMMEYVYFSRPDSNIDGINVHAATKKNG